MCTALGSVFGRGKWQEEGHGGRTVSCQSLTLLTHAHTHTRAHTHTHVRTHAESFETASHVNRTGPELLTEIVGMCFRAWLLSHVRQEQCMTIDSVPHLGRVHAFSPLLMTEFCDVGSTKFLVLQHGSSGTGS